MAGQGLVTVDQTLCVGSGMCIVYAPESFDHDEHAKVVALDPMGDPLDAISTAVEACPTGALRLVPQEQEA
ncbi:ferredoxin [Frankia sp. CNm7]|uniref:Ferredoxin n=1 Tax=Frankia nepalensis TaxID=1836974 RepID=A0A937R718_9ACTN|nr:ferredoxin [Frankia nepalensis]MBL7494781.1 ferredoxin [Frankia nepalensis]MBL7514066.1 ferredoxin [Frankia nepalensis]MBL7521158.1 ferredoxin [Frankia nepalensis]MBL7626481.1 ferredoxin [Frankia nepalensis]